MVKGYQRRVVFLKNTGSEVFDEAYFVISESDGAAKRSKRSMVEEATRIIEENLSGEGKLSARGPAARAGAFFKLRAIPFLLGAAISSGVCLLVFLL